MNGTRWINTLTTSVCVIYLTISVACVTLAQTQGAQAPRETPVPREPDIQEGNRLAQQHQLFVAKHANKLRYFEGPQGEWLQAAYLLSERYPAKATLADLAAHFKNAGWKPLKDDWMNTSPPPSPINRWDEFVDETLDPPRRVWQLKAQWENSKGDIIDYTLRYYAPKRGNGERSDLAINGAWYSAARVAQIRKMIGDK